VQTFEQHCWFTKQFEPAAPQFAATHWPFWQLCEQQSLGCWQGWPAGAHGPAAPHFWFVHAFEQHCWGTKHCVPSAWHVGTAHWPLAHVCEQQSPSTLHAWPCGLQPAPGPQKPATHWFEQQSPSALQPCARPLHAPPQTLLVHAFAQHSIGSVQPAPSGLHAGAPPAPLPELVVVPVVGAPPPVPVALVVPAPPEPVAVVVVAAPPAPVAPVVPAPPAPEVAPVDVPCDPNETLSPPPPQPARSAAAPASARTSDEQARRRCMGPSEVGPGS
jgi:hypothetical protein